MDNDLINSLFAKDQLWRLLEYSIDNTISLTPPLLKAFIMSDIQKGMTFFSPYKSTTSSGSRKKQHAIQVGLIKKGQKAGRDQERRSGNDAPYLHFRTDRNCCWLGEQWRLLWWKRGAEEGIWYDLLKKSCRIGRFHADSFPSNLFFRFVIDCFLHFLLILVCIIPLDPGFQEIKSNKDKHDPNRAFWN